MDDGPRLANELAKLGTADKVEKFFEDTRVFQDWIFVKSYKKLEESDLHASYTKNFWISGEGREAQFVQSMLKPPSEK